MITLDTPPAIILPDHYHAKRPAIIRPGVDLANYFPVEIDRKTRRAIVAELIKAGAIEDRSELRREVEAAIPFGMFAKRGNIIETNFEATDSVSAHWSRQNGSIGMSRVTGISGAVGACAFIDGVSAGATGSWWSWDTLGSISNFDMLVKCKRLNLTSQDGYGILFRAGASTAYGYRFGGTPRLVSIAPNGGTLATLATQTTQLVTQTNMFWVRINANGTALKVRVWQDGDGEPGTWAMSVTDSNYSSGLIGLRSSINNCDWYVDWISVADANSVATYDGS